MVRITKILIEQYNNYHELFTARKDVPSQSNGCLNVGTNVYYFIAQFSKN